MGCFSYMCKECNTSIRSDSASGELVALFRLRGGIVIEALVGSYDSYGSVYDQDWNGNWASHVETHFNKDKSSGFAAVHTRCFKRVPETISDDDPEQGWEKMRPEHLNY